MTTASGGARVVGFDTETCLIRLGCHAPDMVCLTYQEANDNGVDTPQIAHHTTSLDTIRGWLTNKQTTLVGHNVAYDTAVIINRFPELAGPIFQAYEDNRITDTQIRQKLLDIAAGVYRGHLGEKGRWITHGYSLEDLGKRCAGIQLQKDGWRLSYDRFLNTPLDQWTARAVEVQNNARKRLAQLETSAAPDDKALKKEIEGLREMIASPPDQCLRYPLEDARCTLAVYMSQERHAAYLHNQFDQARGMFALHLSSAWGLRTDAEGVATLREDAEKARIDLEAKLIAAGLVRQDGTRDTKAAVARMVAVCKEENLPIRHTASHTKECIGDECHVSLDSDACNATEDDLLMAYAELSTTKKVLSNDVEMLAQGVHWPVHTRYDLLETGRKGSSKPNIQNLRRRFGVREAFVPRPGKVFAQADYPQLELYTLAQCCHSWIGFSKLGDALNAGLDPHLAMAAQILGIGYDEAAANKKREDVDNARQTAKVANFGFPGGLGIEKLILFAKKTYGVDLTKDQARQLKDQWFATWPEMPHYFSRINSLMDEDTGRASVETLWTKRWRGGATYCAACNNGFQALGADCATRAAWLLAKAEYATPTSPLYNSRTVAFVHDEFIVETEDNDGAHDAAHELARLMVEGANMYLPNVPIPLKKMEPLLMRRWSKKAEPRFDEAGRLIPWAA